MSYNVFILMQIIFNSRTSSHKKVRNGERVKEKSAALDVIRDLIIDSPLISKDAKEERLTEVRNLPVR